MRADTNQSSGINIDDQFILLRYKQGFFYRNQFFSTKLKNQFKLTLKQYYAVQHLYDHPKKKIYSKDLKCLIEDSLGKPIHNSSVKMNVIKTLNNLREHKEEIKTDLDEAIERQLLNYYTPERHDPNKSIKIRPADDQVNEALRAEIIASLASFSKRMKLLHFGGQCEKTYIVGGGKQDGSRKYETTVHPRIQTRVG